MGSSAPGELPRPSATVEARLDGGIPAPVRRYGNPEGFRLLMSHGNGLAIDLYYPFWSLFLDDFDVIVFDLRNHGANPLGDLAQHTVPNLCRDLEVIGQTVDRALGVRPVPGSITRFPAWPQPSHRLSPCRTRLSCSSNRPSSNRESVGGSSSSRAARRRPEPASGQPASGVKRTSLPSWARSQRWRGSCPGWRG